MFQVRVCFYEFRENITKSSFSHRYYGFFECYENEHMGEEPTSRKRTLIQKETLGSRI